MKYVTIAAVLFFCCYWSSYLYADSGGKILNILYSVDERGSIIPCG